MLSAVSTLKNSIHIAWDVKGYKLHEFVFETRPHDLLIWNVTFEVIYARDCYVLTYVAEEPLVTEGGWDGEGKAAERQDDVTAREVEDVVVGHDERVPVPDARVDHERV